MMSTRSFLSKLPYLFIVSILTISSCMARRMSNSGRGSTISAIVEGLEEGDDERLKNKTYKLVCESGYEAMGTMDDKGVLQFPDSGLAYNDQCALEIYADKTSGEAGVYSFKWLSKPPVEGLFYSSNLAQILIVANVDGSYTRSLMFKLFKIYGINYEDAFPTELGVQFDLADGDQVPADSEMLANLVCDNKFKYPSASVTKVSDNVRTFSFNLSATLMTGVSCSKIVIAKNNVAIFEGSLSGVSFSKPTKGTVQKFAGPFRVKSTAESFGAPECTSKDGKLCNSITLPRPQGNVWFVVVDAFNEETKKPMQFIAMDANGLGANLYGNVISLIEMQQEVLSAPNKFSFYGVAAENLIAGSNYQPNEIKTYLSAHKLENSALVDLTLKGFARVYVNGFKSVGESVLNAKSTARWFVRVKASAGAKRESYIVAGYQNYFNSPGKPAGNKFFDANTYKSDKSGQYVTYGFESSAAKPGACNIGFSYYVDTMSAKTFDQISGVPLDGSLEACRIKDTSGLASLKEASWTNDYTFFMWGWHKLAL